MLLSFSLEARHLFANASFRNFNSGNEFLAWPYFHTTHGTELNYAALL